MDERRAAPRAPCSMPVRCARGYAVLEDISATGARFVSDFDAQAGELLHLEVCDRVGNITMLYAVVCRSTDASMGRRIACRFHREARTEEGARRLYESALAASA